MGKIVNSPQKDLRKELIKSINKTVDEHQCLGADNIADGIIEDLKLEGLDKESISWTKVEDGLPTLEFHGFVKVLIYRPCMGIDKVLYNTKTKEFTTENGKGFYYGITHWMLLEDLFKTIKS